MLLKDLPTPCLLLDQQKMESNIQRMIRRCNDLKVNLRPHVKTSKSAEVVTRMDAFSEAGITVSTLMEAGYFLRHGFKNQTYAVGIEPGKLESVAALIRAGADLRIILDDPRTATLVEERGRALGVCFQVLIEIDCDGVRAGLEADDPLLLETAACLKGEGAVLKGVLTHAGGSYDCGSREEIVAMAARERATVVDAAERLRAAGHNIEVVSMGSTPTALFCEDASGVTEIRAGVFVFMDLFQAGLGVCRISDIALSVLTTVIGHKRKYGRVIVDAGALALSKDHGTARQSVDRGYGLLRTLEGNPLKREYHVSSVNQEHGLIEGISDEEFDLFPIGSRLRILPSHACMTAAAYDRYFVLSSEASTGAVYERCNGW